MTKNNTINFTLKALTPILKSIINQDTNQIITQLKSYTIPSQIQINHISSKDNNNCLGFLELLNMNNKTLSYLKIQKPERTQSSFQQYESWQSYSHLNVNNESEFLVDTSASKPGTLYTLDFYGNLSEWETNTANLMRSLDDWKKLVMGDGDQNEFGQLKMEYLKESPNNQLKDFKGPKHGKVDEKKEPHVGGNTWAGKIFNLIISTSTQMTRIDLELTSSSCNAAKKQGWESYGSVCSFTSMPRLAKSFMYQNFSSIRLMFTKSFSNVFSPKVPKM